MEQELHRYLEQVICIKIFNRSDNSANADFWKQQQKQKKHCKGAIDFVLIII